MASVEKDPNAPWLQPKVVRKVSKRLIDSRNVGAPYMGDSGYLRKLNRLKGARPRLGELMREKIITWNQDEHAPTDIQLDPSLNSLFPSAFFENPTRWIEAQTGVDRTYTADPYDESAKMFPYEETIEEFANVWVSPYDVTRVKHVLLEADGKKQTLIIKRLGEGGKEELDLARKAVLKGIPTPRVLGEIYHWGNHYGIFEYIPSRSLAELPMIWELARRKKAGDRDLRIPYAVPERDFLSVYGFDLLKERRLLEEAILASGLPHNDFAERNILIRWDQETNQPCLKEEGRSPLLVIDWDPEAHKKGGKLLTEKDKK